MKTFIKLYLFISIFLPFSCKEKESGPSKDLINEINLKRGNVIFCGPDDKKLGSVVFEFSGSDKVRDLFNLAIKLLHSFEYDEAEKVFSKVIDEEPGCAMAYWGVAMSNFHPLWAPPSEAELVKGNKAINIAQTINKKTKREEGYINAIAAFYNDWNKQDHRSRCINFEKAMENLYAAHPTDKEAAIFYALSLTAAADPADKSFAKQKKAGAILASLYPAEPDHPGIVHYIIHTYDSPELAHLALPAARKYASVAPSSAHALHMPSHIFTRLGLWDESINSNLVSVSSAKCYAEEAGIKGHWDEEIHGLDYLVYGYLQKGDNIHAKEQWDYLKTIDDVSPPNFKVAYAFASIPSRYVLENKLWQEAANLKSHKENFPWQNFPWQKAIIHFTRLMGSVNVGNIASAKTELKNLYTLHDTLLNQKDSYKATQVLIQIKTAEGWIKLKEGKYAEALTLINVAADMEDKTEKHPVTPSEVLPARELLGDMLLLMNEPGKALEAYEANLKKCPNRFNGVYGAGIAAKRSGKMEKANGYFRQLLSSVNISNSNRPELVNIKHYLAE
jgi:tetratricopeptide (TPR) repeat protein